MPIPKKIFIVNITSILLTIFILEATLELRHYYLGYNTLLFGTKQSTVVTSELKTNKTNINQIVYGPKNGFPFKSKIIKPEKGSALRIWIASASHAEGGRIPAPEVFPNLICEHTNFSNNCETINGSSPGMRIKANLTQLNTYAPIYKPDYAVLYQMSTIISSQQRAILGTDDTNIETNLKSSNSIFDVTYISKKLQETSLYIHLSDYIGGNIKLQGPLKSGLPKSLAIEFDSQILDFISTCKNLSIQPILATFAASHTSENLHQMHFSKVTNFVKYNTYLSPDGWVNTINNYNNRLREIAKRGNIPLIDTEKLLNGKHEYFIDFFHFNSQGHLKVGEFMGKELTKIILGANNDNDL